MKISQLAEHANGKLEFRVVRFGSRDPGEPCYVKLESRAEEGSLCTWETSTELRWHIGDSRGTPAIVRWQAPGDTTAPCMDLFAWVKRPDDDRISIQLCPVLDPNVKRFLTKSAGFPRIEDAANDPQVKAIVLLRTYQTLSGCFCNLFEQLRVHLESTNFAEAFPFEHTWSRSPRKMKKKTRRRRQKKKKPVAAATATAAATAVRKKGRHDKRFQVLDGFDPEVEAALRKFRINVNHQQRMLDLNLNTVGIWQHVDPAKLERKGIEPHIAEAMKNELFGVDLLNNIPFDDAAAIFGDD